MSTDRRSYLLRIEPALLEALEAVAKVEGESVNHVLLKAARTYVGHHVPAVMAYSAHVSPTTTTRGGRKLADAVRAYTERPIEDL